MDTSAATAPAGVAWSATYGQETGYEAFRTGQRNDIASHLVAIVSERGFGAVNVSELTRSANISRKTFYKYFPTIEAALVYAQRMVLARLATGLVPSAAARNGFEYYVSVLRSIGDAAFEHVDVVRFLSFFDYAVKAFELEAATEDEYEHSLALDFDELVSAFERGQADGSIAAHLDARLSVVTSASAVFGLVQRVVNIQGLHEDPAVARRVIDREIDLWAREIATGDDPGMTIPD